MTELRTLMRQIIDLERVARCLPSRNHVWQWVICSADAEVLREYAESQSQASVNLDHEGLQMFGIPVRVEEHARPVALELRTSDLFLREAAA